MQQNRIRMVAGNWKMNTNYDEGRDLAKAVIKKLQPMDVQLVIAPPFTHLKNINNILHGVANVALGAQNCHEAPSGAYTGEISVEMLRSVGVKFVILGHSERREYFHETDAQIAKKVEAVLAGGLRPIFCCGESLDIRESGKHVEHVTTQLKNSIFQLAPEDYKKVIIAYEPIWAIGTGKTASPKQAQDMHKAIRAAVTKQFGAEIGNMQTILYGGSCKPANAKELFAQEDVDGGLIGGASLDASDFIAIMESF